MANDGQIVFQVEIDGKQAKVNLQELTREIQKETGKWDSAGKQSSDNIGNNFTGMLKKIAAGFSAVKIGKALLDLGKDAIEAASALEEVQNVVDVTFGANSNKIETWAKNAGTQFGLTETQAKKFTSTMGAMLKSSGLAGDQIVDVSTDLAGLAADMASFYNLDFEEAFGKIRSGISGMTMPLKELGIDMSVDTLNAFALAQGLDKTFSQMDQGEQTMLRYQYLMQATADAQGDFARTSDGYANSVRQLETNLTTLKTNLGGVLLDIVNPLINGINELFKDRSGEKTVLDDFAGIDADTEQKIERIKQTAEDARLLVDELDKIGGGKAGKAGSALQQIATSLESVNLDQGKAGIVKDFVAALAQDIPTLAEITGSSNEGVKEWLNGIAESADKLSPEDAEGWERLLNTIKEGLPGLDNTEFGAAFFSALGDGFKDIESQSSVLSWAVDMLGNKTNKTAEEQAVWLETCKRLVKTIPGLSSIINTETGEVKGGTDAVKEYIKAWEDGQVKLAMLGALEQKESALSSRFSDLPELQLNMALEKRRAKKAFEELQEVYKKYGANIGFDSNGKINRNFDIYGLTPEAKSELNAVSNAFETQQEKANAATDAYNLQKAALEEAKQALKEYKETIDELPGNVKDAVDQSEQYWIDNAENIKTVVQSSEQAIKEFKDYVQGVHDSVEASVNSTVKGFGKFQTPLQKQTADLTKELEKLGDRTAKNKTEWDKLTQAVKNSQNATSTTSSQQIKKNLQYQAEYMDDYLKKLNKARSLGISADILAELSDGSVESYDYLSALADATPKEVEQINASYQSVIDKKKELTDELTKQQLSVDKTYQTMADKAKEAVDALNLATEAKDNSGKTVQAIAEGIGEHVSDVKEQVDAIIAELNRLDQYGIDIDFGGFGKISFTTDTGKKADDSGRMGIDFVPRDDYLIRAHEGERLLTAQENQIWNTLLRGGYNGFDLDALGGVMRDNVKAGGNVYLDGKVVGAVVSDRQGRNYRSLQRSGWQS